MLPRRIPIKQRLGSYPSQCPLPQISLSLLTPLLLPPSLCSSTSLAPVLVSFVIQKDRQFPAPAMSVFHSSGWHHPSLWPLLSQRLTIQNSSRVSTQSSNCILQEKFNFSAQTLLLNEKMDEWGQNSKGKAELAFTVSRIKSNISKYI